MSAPPPRPGLPTVTLPAVDVLALTDAAEAAGLVVAVLCRRVRRLVAEAAPEVMAAWRHHPSRRPVSPPAAPAEERRA